MTLRIGLDFDNTLIDYSDVFAKVFVTESARRDITPSELPTGKQAVKQAAIKLAGETFWMSIQGLAYGRGIIDGKLSSGVADFLHTARKDHADLYIASHKTEYGHFDNSKTNLRTAARDWMEDQGFFDPDGFDLHPSWLFFEGTLSKKINRIGALNLDYFIDDLKKVLKSPDFPKYTRGIWFQPQPLAHKNSITPCYNWHTIRELVFGNALASRPN